MTDVVDAPALVVHGHFYQPPREDPWTGIVPEHPEVAPFRDWNERITAECYRPNAERGLFERMSFNVGPTLLSWLEAHHRDVYDRILAADGATGRAIAQAYGHAILPLCNPHDLRTHVRWGITDFTHRFGRRPDGMWLPETAVSEAVLTVLMDEGIRFTILAPRQIDAATPPRSGLYRWQPTSGAGPGVDLLVYDAGLAHALAFDAPTSRAIVDTAVAIGGLVAAATDGETFGHHHRDAHEVLHHVLNVDAPAAGVHLPRLVDLVDSAPPRSAVGVRTSAWSCAHGVERWRSHCGCQTGGHDGSSQTWRGPLRDALDLLRDWGVGVMDTRGEELLRDPWAARDDHLAVQLGARSLDDFMAEHLVADAERAAMLLDAQRNALLMFTSCGWFFNDLAGIETVQILRYAARAIDLYQQMGEAPPVAAFLDHLGEARSNDPTVGDGRRLWFDQVLPR